MPLNKRGNQLFYRMTYSPQEFDLLKAIANDYGFETVPEWLREKISDLTCLIIPERSDNSLFSYNTIDTKRFCLPNEFEPYFRLLEERYCRPTGYLMKKFITDPALLDWYLRTGGY